MAMPMYVCMCVCVCVCVCVCMFTGVQLELDVLPDEEGVTRALDTARYGSAYYHVM